MKNRNEATALKPEQVRNDLRTLISDAEKAVGATIGEHTEEALHALRERLAAAQERFTELYADARKKVVSGAQCTNEAIHEHPYQSLGIALGVGVLLGVLVGRRMK